MIDTSNMSLLKNHRVHIVARAEYVKGMHVEHNMSRVKSWCDGLVEKPMSELAPCLEGSR